MSYADAAASGPSQTAAEKRAPAPPQLDPKDDTSIYKDSMPDVDSPHISSITSEATESLKTSTQKTREQLESSAAELRSSSGSSSGDKGKQKADQARKKARETADKIQDKTGQNPIALGNMVLAGVLASALGVNVYQRWQSGQGFGSQFVMGWVGVVGAVGVGDYLLSKWAGGKGYGNN